MSIQAISFASLWGVISVAAIAAALTHLAIRVREYHTSPDQADPSALKGAVIGTSAALVSFTVPLLGGLAYGASFSSSGSEMVTRLSPGTLVAWPIAIAVVWLAWRRSSEGSAADGARWPRVLLALYVDFAIYLTVVAVPVCVLSLGLEWQHTQSFCWEFSRDFSRSSDVGIAALALVGFAACWAAFGVPFWARRDSPGGLFTEVTFHTASPNPFWRCATFGIFHYFRLAVPLFRFLSVGGLSASVVRSPRERAA